MKLIIAGDLVPTNNNKCLFENGQLIENFDKKLKKIWFDADYRIFNLECVLGDEKKLEKIRKNGPNLIASEKTILGINSLNPNLILLANNHIFDYGEKGLKSTIETLCKQNIKYTGIIENSNAHIEPVIYEKDGIKVGIYNLCENEFSIATKNNIGANGFYSTKNYEEIKKIKKNVDHIIVCFHGGKEFYRYPSPYQQEVSHKLIDFGADMVIFQHSHCIGCEEEYKKKKIVYGQGNFIFHGGDNEFWNDELIIELTIDKKKINVKYHPIEKTRNLITYSNDKKIIERFTERTNKIKKDGFIEKEYNKFALEYLENYLYILNGKNIINRIIYKIKLKGLFIKKYNLKSLLAIQNIIQCEAHKELLITGIIERIKEIEGEIDED